MNPAGKWKIGRYQYLEWMVTYKDNVSRGCSKLTSMLSSC